MPTLILTKTIKVLDKVRKSDDSASGTIASCGRAVVPVVDGSSHQGPGSRRPEPVDADVAGGRQGIRDKGKGARDTLAGLDRRT